MRRKLLSPFFILMVIVAATLWFLSAPGKLNQSAFANLSDPDIKRGEQLYWVGGCASCHAAPGAKGDEKRILAGGLMIESDFGTFYAPNISSDVAAGIGGWTFEQFANAMKKGVSPDGNHLYPSFPYTSYTRMTVADLNDLWVFMKTLPSSSNVAPEHALRFPFNIRRAIGLWNLIYLREGAAVSFAETSDVVKRGQYLVEGAGHCGECHTPRTMIGGPKFSQWLAGAKSPDSEGIIPNITPDGSVRSWSTGDIAYYLETGFKPDFTDTVGGSMVAVQENIAKLPNEDRQAIAVYLRAIPGRPTGFSDSRK